MSTQQKPASNEPKKTVRVIGFGHRLAATLLDGVFVFFLSMMVGLVVGLVAGLLNLYTPNRPLRVDLIIWISMIVFSIAYYVAAWTKSGQTIGHTVLGIKVVGADGIPISWEKALLRYVGYIISAAVFSLGFVWVLWDKKRQGWHDKIAGTYVVFVEDHFSDANAVAMMPTDPGRHWLWIVLWVVLGIGLPLTAITSIITLGPTIGVMVSSFFANLR
jgi:uncharacterized RDD family membrane protein YckC